jgi:effector-binding domain-containing protein
MEPPQIIQSTPRRIAFIHIRAAAGDVRKVMGPALKELKGAITEQGVAITGPWFTHHLRRPAEYFDFEICFPVSAPVAASGRMRPGELPAMTMARTLYSGGYEGLGAAWGQFDAWVSANGHAASEELWECYVTGPESSEDTDSYRTELSRELKGE